LGRRSLTPLAAALLFTAITAIIGRDVLANLGTSVANDPGDPLLTAAILQWNATHVPLTAAWWNFPSFYPTPDVLAFSEHLLGLSVIASPIYWITGDALVTYNLTTLLTFVLSALAMYALVWRLTGSAPAALVAGLAFGFAPYRVSQLPHIQMLAAFWAPLALLGLHAYLETGKRRWLLLYGVTWLLQAAANGYAMFFFSILVGLWTLWFVVAAGRWRALAMITVATIAAALPLAPILYKYLTVHALHGFERGLDEVRFFSGDIAAVLCAPEPLTFWGWIRVMCRPEGELFPGVALFALALVALARLLGWFGGPAALPARPWLQVLRRLFIVVAIVYGLLVASVVIIGPWKIDWGLIRVSTTTVRKPLMVMLGALVAALALSPGVRAALHRSSSLGFYLVAAVATWLLSLGPTLTFMEVPTGVDGPFSWLLPLPGMDGLRVPARFWLMTNVCLSVVAGLLIADLLVRRSRVVTAVATIVVGAAVLADGWAGPIASPPAPASAPDAASLRGALVIELPIGGIGDIAAQWRAITGGWTTVNGYSGWQPGYYGFLAKAERLDDDATLSMFRGDRDLSVLVGRDDPRLIALVERQPGARREAANASLLQYRLPQQRKEVAAVMGTPLPIARLQTDCMPKMLPFGIDRDLTTRWVCNAAGDGQVLTIELDGPKMVSAFVQTMGRYTWEAPRYLIVETSVDGSSWETAWSGSILEQTIEGELANPASLRIVVPFSPRPARLLRVRTDKQEPGVHWTIPEVEVLGENEPG
jgi:hypothetical protein